MTDSERFSGARLISVWNEQALVLMPVGDAVKLTGGDADAARPMRVVTAVERDLERLRRRDGDLADSALAQSAVVMAFEIENPYNSATSKSYCQARLAETLRELRELAPPEAKKDALTRIGDEVAARRAARAANKAGA